MYTVYDRDVLIPEVYIIVVYSCSVYAYYALDSVRWVTSADLEVVNNDASFVVVKVLLLFSSNIPLHYSF